MMLPAWLYLATLFAAGWFCCRCQAPYDPPPCGICTADDDAMSITIAGLSNGTYCTGCAYFNATFILARQSGNACLWQRQATYYHCGPYLAIHKMTVIATTLAPGTSKGFIAGLEATYFLSGIGHVEYTRRRWNSGSASSFDCTATRVTSSYLYLQDSGCDGWSTATITINP